MRDRDLDTARITLKRPPAIAVLVFCVGVFVVLATLDVIGVASGKDSARIVSLDAEVTIGTWWASAQLLALAGLLFLVGRREQHFGRSSGRLAVWLGCAVAVMLSIDETAGVHELIAGKFEERGIAFIGDGSDTWLFLYGLILLIALVFAVPGIISLWRTDRGDLVRLLIGAILLVIGGAVLGGVRVIHDPGVWDVVFEESFEFIGVAIMVWGAYRMLSSTRLEVPV